MRALAGWRPSLRMAWRDARRSRARSILVLVMIALPVLGVTAADVVIQTQDVSGAESLDRRLGAADARVTWQQGISTVAQGFDPDDQSGTVGGGRSTPLRGPDEISELLGRDVRAIEWRRDVARVLTDGGALDAETDVLDLRDPLAEGIFVVESGRVPAAPDEVVVNRALAERGFDVGDRLEVDPGAAYTVVGVGESTSYRDAPRLVGISPALAGKSESAGMATWLVDAGPVTWSEVLRLNAAGASVLSRAVLTDPPPESALPAEIRSWDAGPDRAVLATAGLIVVMALIEVVLLAGPAFAVGARRQSRTLALLAATGGTPRQARRVVLASGLVLGGLGAALGVLLGLGLAVAVLPVLQRFSGSWFGPYDVPWLHLLGIALFGLLSAFLAAVVPAWIASRQDVVAVLAGRRGDRPARLRSPLLGLALLGAGLAGSAYGAVGPANGEILIAGSAIPAVLGMILLVPVVLSTLGRLSRALPLTMRYAVRDAARHRTRTVPAVAAVAATVAGVVALGIANASDAAQNRATYTPVLPMGHAAVNAWMADADDWARFRSVLDQEVPDANVREIRGLEADTDDGRYRDVGLRIDSGPVPLEGWHSMRGSSVLVSRTASDEVLPDLTAAEQVRAEAALATGGAVLYSAQELPDQEVTLRVPPLRKGGEPVVASVRATFVQPPGGGWEAPVRAVLSPAAARTAGIEPATVSLLVTSGLTEDQAKNLEEALQGISPDVGLYVERGYPSDEETMILLLVLGGLGGLLMLGGTLTATFLALSDARPDLATLSAVGASPRTRRGVASSYAVVVGLVGALLGAAIGFVPGVAITYPLTGPDTWGLCGSDASGECAGSLPTHYLDVPWLLIGTLVLALPLLTALVVGLAARSRLPLVARLD